ncbi:MAG: sensor histidine kinase [Chloroflexi bacterium OHK40]
MPEPTGASGPAGRLLSTAWLRERLLPTGAGSLMIASYAIIMTALVNFILSRRELPPLIYTAVILLISAMFVLHVVGVDLQARLGPARGTWLHLGLNGAFFLAASYLSGPGLTFLPFVLFMLSAEAIVDLPDRPALAYVAALSGGYLLTLVLLGFGADQLLVNMVSIGLGLIFTALFARVLKIIQQQNERAEGLLAELRAANAALAAASAREKELAAAEERVRLAREIHDGLGHHLTVLNVQLQAAAQLIELDPERAAETVALCRQEARAALEEVRQSVATLRRSPLDGRELPEALAALVADFDRASPLEARFEVLGTPFALAPAVAMTLYRAAQEGLTNAQKHAGTGEVHVELAFGEATATVRVRDSGSAQAGTPTTPGGGFGIAGLRERAAQLGGRLGAGPASGGGFLLELEVPR